MLDLGRVGCFLGFLGFFVLHKGKRLFSSSTNLQPLNKSICVSICQALLPFPIVLIHSINKQTPNKETCPLRKSLNFKLFLFFPDIQFWDLFINDGKWSCIFKIQSKLYKRVYFILLFKVSANSIKQSVQF